MTYTYLTLGSWECGAENRKGKILSLSFSPQRFLLSGQQQAWDFSHSICSQMQTVPIRTCSLCLLCRGKGHAHIIKNNGSRLGKHLQGISQKPFFTDDLVHDRYKKNLPSLKDNSLSCIRYVRQYCFPKKTELFSLVRAPSLSRNLCHTVVATQCYTANYYCVPVDFQ
jgi:hypothetical protein